MGFAYGLLDVLNSHFQATLNINASKASGLSAAYFGAYFLCPLTISGWILRRYGFRVTFMAGKNLVIALQILVPRKVSRSCRARCWLLSLLAKWSKSILRRFLFVAGTGLSTLEAGADNFLSTCGPPRCSKIRLNLARGIQRVGSFVAPLLASRDFFAKTVNTKEGLKRV